MPSALKPVRIYGAASLGKRRAISSGESRGNRHRLTHCRAAIVVGSLPVEASRNEEFSIMVFGSGETPVRLKA